MLMRDSKMAEDWITRMVARNPITKNEDGTFVTCPVRLSFPNIFRTQKRKRDDSDEMSESYNATLLFPPGATEQIGAILWPAWIAECKTKFPNNWGQDGSPFGLHWPFHDCKEAQQYSGYTPGLQFVACNSQFKPQVVDTAMNPIVDENRVYPGVWAIVKLNLYTYSNRKKGAGFGLQNVMIVADDTRLAGGGSDPAKDFERVKIDAAFDPSSSFAASPASGGFPPPPGSIMPPATPVSAPAPDYAPPPPMAPPAMDYDPLND